MICFVFSCIVNCALSGMESFMLSDTAHSHITTVLFKHARNTMGKKATQVTQNDAAQQVWSTYSNEEISSQWQLLSHKNEMILRRAWPSTDTLPSSKKEFAVDESLQSPLRRFFRMFLLLMYTSSFAFFEKGRAPPKSVSFMCPLSVIKIFSGFRSQ